MTRINAGIDPKLLHRRHLVAELREITMVPAALRRSMRTRTMADILKGVPKRFSLGKGHVTFFYDKMVFLRHRFDALTKEMVQRGYTPDTNRIDAFHGFDSVWNNDWTPTYEDSLLVQARIDERKQQKPHLYV